MKVLERSVQEIGKSLLVTLPKEWTKLVKVDKGSKIKFVLSDEGSLLVTPAFVKKDRKREASFDYDEHFQRRFFRAYFQGNDKIIIRHGKLSSKERQELYGFLRRFMNAQIIEETAHKIVVKCFEIELSVEECIRRMYFLSLNLMDVILEGEDPLDQGEIKETCKKFYYMLVLQIRIFLGEGKFSKQNDIPLIRALDFRMVAERISRIGGLLRGLGRVMDPDLQKFLKVAKDYYKEAFSAFIGNNFEKGLVVGRREFSIRKKFEKMEKKFDRNRLKHKQFHSILQIVVFSREMSMLIR